MLPNLLETTDLVIFNEEELNGRIHFVCSAYNNCLVMGI